MKQDKQIALKGSGTKRATISVERLILRKNAGNETSLIKATFNPFTGKSPAEALLKGLKYIKEQLESFAPEAENLMQDDEILMFVRLTGKSDESIESTSFNKSPNSIGWLTHLIEDFEKSFRFYKRKY
jgi:hypothetical protein